MTDEQGEDAKKEAVKVYKLYVKKAQAHEEKVCVPLELEGYTDGGLGLLCSVCEMPSDDEAVLSGKYRKRRKSKAK